MAICRWLALSFAGLVAIYWISTTSVPNHLFGTADSTIDSLGVGGALLVPVLLGPTRREDPARV